MAEKSNRLAAYREHAFLIIQTHKRIYRAEVDQHPKVKDHELLVVRRTHELFDDQEHFIRACKAALKGLIPEEEALEKAPLYHWTWLVSKEKVAELLADIEKDRGDEEHDLQPFSYFRPGNESIFNPAKLPSTIKTALSTILAYTASDITQLAVEKAFVLTVFPQYLTTFTQALQGVPNSKEKLQLFYYGYMVATYIASYGSYKILKGAMDIAKPTIEKHRYHSCATWALEKLYNLDIPEINETIEPGLFAALVNQLVYIPSFNIGDNAEALRASKILTKTVVALLYERCVPNSVKEEVINPYISMMKYGAEEMKNGLLIGGSTGTILGSTAVASCCMGKSGRSLVVVLGGSAIGATTAVVGTQGIKQHATFAKELMNESWVEKTQSSVLDPQEEDIQGRKARENP